MLPAGPATTIGLHDVYRRHGTWSRNTSWRPQNVIRAAKGLSSLVARRIVLPSVCL